MTWARVRQLARYGDIEFQYGADGIRWQKKNKKNNNTTTYVLSGSRILKETRGNISLTYYYGMSGVIGFQYDDEDYFYQKNLQGDITGIYTAYGTLVAEYKYDAWGKVLAVVNHTSANIGDLNPFRYRGYYYDTETGLYYLQSRYYDPETGRFINADNLAYLGADETLSSYNLYAYCNNNPVNNVDFSGNFAISTFLIGLAVTNLATWALSEILGEKIVGGTSSVINGGSAIYTGIGLLSFGPVGWVAGGALILVGGATVIFGANEIAAGISGTNYLQEAGMSSSLYIGLYTGLNLGSSLGTIAGNIYMRYANVSGTNNPGRTGKPLSRYSTIDDRGIKQYRFFDSAGDAWYDIDFRHGGNMKFPHYHGWKNGSKADGHWSLFELIQWLFTGGNKYAS